MHTASADSGFTTSIEFEVKIDEFAMEQLVQNCEQSSLIIAI